MGSFGIDIPRPSPQIPVAENRSSADNLLLNEKIAVVISKFFVVFGRSLCGDAFFMNVVSMINAMLIAKWKVKSETESISLFSASVVLWFGCCFLPNAYPVGYIYSLNSKMMMRALRRARYLRTARSLLPQDVIKKIVSGECEPKDPFKPGLNFFRKVRGNNMARIQADSNVKKLLDNGIKMPYRFTVDAIPENTVENVIGSVAPQLNNDVFNEIAKKIVFSQAKTRTLPDELKFLKYIKFSITNQPTKRFDVRVSMNECPFYNWLHTRFELSIKQGDRFRSAYDLNFLLKQRRDLTPESIIEYVLSLDTYDMRLLALNGMGFNPSTSDMICKILGDGISPITSNLTSGSINSELLQTISKSSSNGSVEVDFLIRGASAFASRAIGVMLPVWLAVYGVYTYGKVKVSISDVDKFKKLRAKLLYGSSAIDRAV
jgi:hypothetical protein